MDILESELVSAVPVTVVEVLPDDGVRTGGAISVHLCGQIKP